MAQNLRNSFQSPEAMNKKKTKLPTRNETIDKSASFYAGPFEIKFAEVDGAESAIPTRIPVFKSGTYTKVLPNGKKRVVVVTPKHLEDMVENFDAKVLGVDPALDFSHDAGAKAAAWFKKLEVVRSGDGRATMFADVNWTKSGHDCIEGKEFRYVSPEFSLDYQDPHSGNKFGPVLKGAGLTNRPVINDIAPIVELTEVESMAKAGKKNAKKKISELNFEELEHKLSTETDPEKVELIELRMSELSEEDGDEPEPKEAASGEAKPFEKMSEEEKKAAFEAKCAEVDELKAKATTAMSEVETLKKKTDFDARLAKGQVVEAQRRAFMSNDMIKFAELAAPVKLSAVGSSSDDAESDDDTDPQDEVLKLAQEKVTLFPSRFPIRSAAISEVLSENPVLAKRYQQAFDGGAEA